MHPLFRSSVRFAALSALLALASAPAAAQSSEHDAAYQVVTRLFDSMRARDTAAMRGAFVPNASMQSLTANGVKFDGVEAWISGIGRAPAGLMLDERLANPVVHVDGDLASIWVDYWFFAGDRFSHCGVDAFLLAKREGAWKVFSVVDTRRTQGCPPAPPRVP
jgi:Putative lumazine-binding